jgi:hypothetical protein
MRLLVLCLILLLSGCVASRMQEGVAINSLRKAGAPAGQSVKKIQISRKQYHAAVAQGAEVNSLRMVPVFRGPQDGSGALLPEYRLFEIRQKSVFDMMGLLPADVLVAAHGYVVYEPNSFPIYALRFLSEIESPSLEIKRAGTPLLLTYEFVD